MNKDRGEGPNIGRFNSAKGFIDVKVVIDIGDQRWKIVKQANGIESKQ